MVMVMTMLTRSGLARRCGVNPETVRFYERRGILPHPSRTPSNYRVYGEETVKRLLFIKRSKELGFTLGEIQELLSLRAAPGAECADVRSRAEAKILDIEGKIRALRSMKKALSGLMAECGENVPVSECPILEALDADDA